MAATPSLLTIHMAAETLNGFVNTVAAGTINVAKTIEPQTIILRGYRVECASSAYALTQQIVYVDVPWLGGYSLTDGLTYMSRLPLLLDNAVVTLKTEMTTPLRLSGPITSQFTYTNYNRNGTIVTPISGTNGITAITLQMSYGSNTITGSL